jgi:hypothetical protein
MADVAPEGHGWQQWPWQTMPMVSGRFGFTKKNRSDVELAPVLVLGEDFPQKATINNFIVR